MRKVSARCDDAGDLTRVFGPRGECFPYYLCSSQDQLCSISLTYDAVFKKIRAQQPPPPPVLTQQWRELGRRERPGGVQASDLCRASRGLAEAGRASVLCCTAWGPHRRRGTSEGELAHHSRSGASTP